MGLIKPAICKTCGVPKIWSKWIHVDSDNASIEEKSKCRGAFYETDEIQNLFMGVQKIISTPINHICMDSHQEVIRYFFDANLDGIRGGFAKRHLARTILEQMTEISPLFGVGTLRLVEYERGDPAVVESQYLWNEEFFKAEVAGAYEAATGDRCEVEQKKIGNRYLQIVKPVEGGIENHEGRFLPARSRSMGSRDYPRCGACGAPASFQIYSWDKKRGYIIERDTNLRVVYMVIAMVDNMVRELEEEFGGDIRGSAIRVQADYVKSRILSGAYDKLLGSERDERGRIADYLDLLRRRCFGKPIVVELDGKNMKAAVRNPESEVLVLGRLLGTYEAVTGTQGKLCEKREEEEVRADIEAA